MTTDTTAAHGAFVEALAGSLGPMLEPAELERLVVMARLADAAEELRAALAGCADLMEAGPDCMGYQRSRTAARRLLEGLP